MSLEIITRKWHTFTEKCIEISLHAFLPFDELSHILPRLLGLNSVLKPISLPQMQIQCCICKTYHFFLSLIRAISVKKMKMTYSNRNHCWIISQIKMKLLSSAGKVEHSFLRFVFASKFSFFLSFFSFLFFLMKWIASSRAQGIHATTRRRAEEGSRCTKNIA